MKETIVLIGTSTSTRGGIGYVIGDMLTSTLKDKYTLIHILTHQDGSKIFKLLFYIRSFLQFLFLAMFYKPSLVHIHSSAGPSFIRKSSFALLCKLFSMKYIFHIHSGGFLEYFQMSNLVIKNLMRWVLMHAAVVIVLTEHWKKEMLGLFPDLTAIEVLPNPVDTEKYRLTFARKNLSSGKILFLGAIIKEKGVYDLLRALKILQQEKHEVSAVIAGDREIEKARKMADDLGLGNKVHFPGWVNLQEKLKLLNDSDIFVLPSYREGLPLSILEAMACKLPVVTSRVGGIPDVVVHGENGFLIEPGDVDSLAHYIKMLLVDPILWEKISRNNTEKINIYYSIKIFSGALEKIYENIITIRSENRWNTQYTN
jgi:glycosyltransferase involved in cell wall biosynthesis